MDMKNPDTRIKVIAGAVAAVVAAIAVGATGAIAASRVLSSTDESKAVIDDAAAQLGVESSELSDALEQALKNRVDEAVEAGRLTEEQGDAMKERIDSGEVPLVGGFGHKGFGHKGLGFGRGHFGGLTAAATYLGFSEAELRTQLADGKTLAEVARAEGKSVDGLVDAMVKDAEARVDQAVADGKLTEDQATAAKERVTERVTALVNGELRARGLGRWGDRSPGFRGPWHGERPGA
jgi:Skp family chaperone for outer membrane proteins